jgi:LacI family transcriptional regulator
MAKNLIIAQFICCQSANARIKTNRINNTKLHHFFSNIIKGIITRAENHGYLVIILQSNESLELKKKQVALLINKSRWHTDILTNDTNDDDHLKAIIERKA